jgi:hypothetical protein
MPERAIVTSRVRGGASRAKGAGQLAFDRLTLSVEAAQDALKDLRKEVSKGTRDVLRDLDTTLRDARKNLRSVSKTVTNDLEKVQQALTTGKPAPTRAAHPRKRAATAPTARKATTAAKATTVRKPSAAAKTTAKRAEPTAASSEQEPLAGASPENETGSARER